MKFFADTAEIAEIRELAATGLLDGVTTNAACPPALLEDVAQPDPEGLSLIRDAANAMRLSARGFHRVLKVGRTLADLDGEEQVRRIHIAEALSYRSHTDRRPAAA